VGEIFFLFDVSTDCGKSDEISRKREREGKRVYGALAEKKKKGGLYYLGCRSLILMVGRNDTGIRQRVSSTLLVPLGRERKRYLLFIRCPQKRKGRKGPLITATMEKSVLQRHGRKVISSTGRAFRKERGRKGRLTRRRDCATLVERPTFQ